MSTSPPGSTRSFSSTPVLASRTCVPTGTRTTRFSPSLPPMRLTPPGLPPAARSVLRPRSPWNPCTSGDARSTTSPPSPPSPPAGPPLATYFSRRKETMPSPPFPPLAVTRISSWNIVVPARGAGAASVLLRRVDVDAAAGAEPHDAIGGREDREVAREARVLPGAELRAELPHDDGAARHALAAVGLEAAVLGAAVAPVLRGAGALLVCHDVSPLLARDDRLDDRFGVVLAVTALLVRVLAPT